MTGQKSLSLSMVLVFVALVLQFFALSQFGRAARLHRTLVASPESQRAAITAMSKSYDDRGRFIGFLGFVFALASTAAVITSAVKRERTWRSIPIALLIFYLTLQFVVF